jgi:hypothetical protein
LKRGEVLQFAVGTAQDIGGAIDKIIAATSTSHDGLEMGLKKWMMARIMTGKPTETTLRPWEDQAFRLMQWLILRLKSFRMTHRATKKNPFALHVPKRSVIRPTARRSTRIAIKTSCESAF